jgi:SOS-response transcriptional repressor LexA
VKFNKKQKKIINSKPTGHMLIKGAIGTGKTTAYINRIPLLLNHYCISNEDKILVASYNEDVSKRFLEVYSNIESQKYHQSSFFDEDNSDKLEIRTIDSLMLYYFKQYKKKYKDTFNIVDSKECIDLIKKAIETVADKYKKINILTLDFAEFIQNEIMWIKASNLMKLEEYQNANRNGRLDKLSGGKPKALRKNSKQRQAIFDVLEEYNGRLRRINKIDAQDVALLALEEAQRNKTKAYTHIFIDDSQRLTKVQLEFLKALYNEMRYSSITFVFDSSEEKRQDAWLSSGRSFASLGYDMKGKSISLSEIYVSEEISSKANVIDEIQLTEKEPVENSNLSSSTFSLDAIEYIDLNRNVSHKFIKDSGSSEEIYIEDNGVEEKVDEVISIPLFNEIAAGNPILINDSLEENYSLPKDWIRNPKNVFMLKVKGDSMINKNICDGDYVIINRQNAPNIKDIVAVDIDGEATLKTYRIIDGKISLNPENEK